MNDALEKKIESILQETGTLQLMTFRENQPLSVTLDSLFLATCVVEIEHRFKIEFILQEINIENFSSISNIAKTIRLAQKREEKK